MAGGALARGRTLEFKFPVHVTFNKTLISVLGKMRGWIVFLSSLKEVLFLCASKQLKPNIETVLKN